MAWWPGTLRFLRRRRVFTAYVLAGSLAILMIVGWGAYRVAGRVEQQAQLSTWLLSHIASVDLVQGQGGGLQEVLLRSRELDVPFIVTDNQGRPLLWNSPVVGIPMPDSLETLARVNPAGGNGGDLDRILALVKQYDARNEPFAITDPRTGQRVLTLHYGASALSRQIRWLPYAELALLAVFFLLIVWALSLQREGHEQKLFAGMAKETAHQLGTPITSIMGWLEILRDRRPDDVVEELGRDVARLGKVSERFSQIGSRPQLADADLAATVESTVAYFRRRLPHLGGHVEITVEDRLTRGCRFNRDLLEWVLENLIKNGIDALKDGVGEIALSLDDGPDGTIQLRVRDTGCGVAPQHRNRIFEAGYTTKSRGWGMGLALVRRIVVQYHNGRIQIEETGAGGTTFLITLPGEEPFDAV